MEYRRTPTFVNLKSNTMKNTMQIYEENFNLQEIRTNYLQFITKINKNAKIFTQSLCGIVFSKKRILKSEVNDKSVVCQKDTIWQ